MALAAGQKLGLVVHVLRHADIPAATAERESLARLWEREAVLSNGALLVDAGETDAADCARTLLPFLENLRGIVMVSRREPLPTRTRPVVRFDVSAPTPAEQKILWQQSLGEISGQLNGQVARMVTQFNLAPEGIRAACAGLKKDDGNDAALGTKLWEACRVQARLKLDDLAQRIEPFAGWDDLVLPGPQKQILREVSAHVRQRAKVYETWGFASKGARGLGISALFTGISGTGKTMAAEVLASELRLDLYRIDLSSVVSKYIGETEKNLRRVFDAAEAGGAILLFDEADALFGKRSEVKDSHDRYANIEVSYLLQRMEAYRGLAILTTNLKDSLDTAFMRRIRFVVQFPFPDAAHRAEIWRRIFPADTPTEALDPLKLSRLNVAGGNIRNIALNAAFLAADANEPVCMGHLLRAARAECVKMEKPLTESETGGWA
ncbi:MAG: ATP-binding protein [Verrucomicrobia bacterium]|nr:ATP-binding protein [Verrucomicrobiota bacterium]